MDETRLISIRRYEEKDGGLSCIEYMQEVPFFIKRIFTIDGIPKGEIRADHAIRNNYFFYTVVNGSVTIEVDSGENTKIFCLNSKDSMGVLMPPLHWVRIKDLSSNATFIAMASKEYDKDDYINDYQLFLEERRKMEDTK